ncbi:MAG: hypothetical protein O3B73_18835 [bacterium]|jgi:anti-sigma factor RsiW|nr:hypothetical protein [bacterium]
MSDTDKLLHYLDGNLSAEESRALEVRLAGDPALRLELDLHRRIQSRISQRPAEASPGLWVGIEAQLEAEQPESIWPHLVWVSKRLIPFMAAAAIILMAVSAGRQGDASSEITLNDYLTTQTDLVLSEVSASDLVHYSDAVDQ